MKLTSFLFSDPLFAETLKGIRTQREAARPLPILVNGLTGGAEDAFCCEAATALSRECGTPVLFLVPDETRAASLTACLTSGGVRAHLFRRRPPVYRFYPASHDMERERLFVLRACLSGDAEAVVATPAAALGYLMPKETLATYSLSLEVGREYPQETLLARLAAFGYTRCDLVEAPGQYARRGGIVDFWQQAGDSPLRMEYFGDEIDRMGYFDPLTQRVTETVSSYTLLPAREVLLDEGAVSRVRASIARLRGRAEGDALELLKREETALSGDEEFLSRDRFLPLIYPERNTLFDYFPEKPPVFFMGTNEVTESYRTEWESEHDQIERLMNEGVLEEKYAGSLSDEKTFTEILSHTVPVHLNAFGGGSFRKEGGIFGFRCRRLPTYADSPKALLDDLSSYLKLSYTVLLVCETSAEAAHLRAYLTDAGYQAVIAPEGLTPENAVPGVVYLLSGWDLSSGYELLTPRLAVLSTLHGNAAASPRRLSQGRKRRFTPGRTILSYLELKPGDLVVHEKYGIGRFTGIETLRQDGVCRDYITIQYAGTDRLFIPADALDAVTKYVGGEDGKVPLSKMGGTAWTKTKSRAKAAAKEMAQELIALYAARMREPGIAFPRDEEMETEFAGNFPYELTDCQTQALEDIFRDMERPTPMDRLLCGDVGYGKTEVALRAAFRAIANGKQVAILVPTTILALQHYETAVSRMRGFAVKVDMLSRMRTPREQAAVRRRVARGETDLIIGTHSLLAGSTAFKRLGLLIVDEEQRFGVAQKEKIKSFAKDIDVLTLTATPIPRTLNMAVGGIRDLSVLDLAPGDRRPVETYVLEYAEEPIYSAIQKELARAGQVLYLYNRIETIDLVAGRVQKAFPGARVAYAHGQMERGVVEDIWQALVRGEIDILICTTIIETGVDLPNANTLIIEDADRLGLAQLHQIRGRIGRSSRQAYAYLTYRAGKVLTEESRQRLAALREYTEFGAGFRIALRDMEIRGAGNLLGADQHGHILSVGYDLYVKLLEEAVLTEQGKPKTPAFESKIDLKVDAYLPDSYIPSSAHRMELYKKISLIETEEDREDLIDELCDRFGDPPKPAQNLTYVALCHALAVKCRILTLTRDEKNLMILAEKPDPDVWAELYHAFDGFRPPSTRSPYLTLGMKDLKNPARTAAEMMRLYSETYEALHKEVPNAD